MHWSTRDFRSKSRLISVLRPRKFCLTEDIYQYLMQKKNKQKNQKAAQSNTAQNQPHQHGEHCNHSHDHAHQAAPLLEGNQTQSLMSTLNLLPKLNEMLNGLQGLGGQQIKLKPEDPLPDFTQFDAAKQILENTIGDFQETLKLIEAQDFSKLEAPAVVKANQSKLSKQQQQIKEKNHKIIKSNIDYLNTLQNELKTLGKDPLLVGIKNEIDRGVQNLALDGGFYQRQLEI